MTTNLITLYKAPKTWQTVGIHYYQAFAFSLTDTGFGEIKSFTRGFICGESRIVDIDGNIYETVQIGAQCWMKSNLKTTYYKNGDPIPYNVVWSAQNTTDARTEPAADYLEE